MLTLGRDLGGHISGVQIRGSSLIARIAVGLAFILTIPAGTAVKTEQL